MTPEYRTQQFAVPEGQGLPPRAPGKEAKDAARLRAHLVNAVVPVAGSDPGLEARRLANLAPLRSA